MRLTKTTMNEKRKSISVLLKMKPVPQFGRVERGNLNQSKKTVSESQLVLNFWTVVFISFPDMFFSEIESIG